MSNETHPYGVCQCSQKNGLSIGDGPLGGGCCGGTGPALIAATRDGKRMIFCTYCDLSSDKDRKTIGPVTSLFEEYDSLGAYCARGFKLETPN